MNIYLIPGYPDTSESLRSRISIIARIPGYIYPDISPDTIHRPVLNEQVLGMNCMAVLAAFSSTIGELHCC